MKYASLCLFFLISTLVLSQTNETETPEISEEVPSAEELVGCWNLLSERAEFVWEKSDEMSEKKSGFCFEENGELTKRVATTWEGEVVQLHDYKGRWEITSPEMITLTYYFDEQQTVQESVKITQFDSARIKWLRQDWKEVRK
jgi:hypothetical protein